MRHALTRERASEEEKTRLADQARGSHLGRSGRAGKCKPKDSASLTSGEAVEIAFLSSAGNFNIMPTVPWQ